MWSLVGPHDPKVAAPSARSKHSATLVGDQIYLLGGRNGNIPLKDFWTYNLVSGKWKQCKPTGDRLPALQEHTALFHKGSIYVFGGEVSFSAGTETPLWCYNIKNNNWMKIRSKKGVATPKGRRGHTALVYRGSMLIYGGYQDLRGSCSELWAFHFETESWHLLSVNNRNSSDFFPPARHKHSAVLHEDSMWIYGGMTDLQERGDFWRWDLVTKTWTNIKTKINPGPLHSHAVCKLPASMLLFGGDKNGHLQNDLWKFNFAMETWEKIVINGPKPQPRAESIAFAVSQLVLKSDPSSIESKSHRIRSKTCERNRHSSYIPANNRVAPSEQTYLCNNTNVVDGRDSPEDATNTRKSFLQEISKLKQIARLNSKCNYTVLAGCPTESTESLLKQFASPGEPGRNLVKSKSAYAIRKKQQQTTNVELPHEPSSVPNFSLVQLPTPVLSPVEAARLVFVDESELHEHPDEQDTGNVKRGDSYSSHLGYADNPLYSVRVEAAKTLENVSSTSDYASIETVNRLSSESSYGKENEGPFGFCNPNYLGPDLHKDQEPSLELQEVNGRLNGNATVYYRHVARYHSARCNTERKHGGTNVRPLSSSRVEKRTVHIEEESEIDAFVPLYVFVLGGKEQGQVTVFERPVSMWKLKLF